MLTLLVVTHGAVTNILRRLRCLFRLHKTTDIEASVDYSRLDHRRNYEETYTIRCGVAVIFNNVDYPEGPRRGTLKDEETLKTTLADLGLGVMVYRDVDTTTLLRQLQRVARMDHGNRDCFVCVILSHGGQSELTQEGEQRMCDIIRCRNNIISARKLVGCLTDDVAPTLVNKPRLFFFQACRGEALPATVEIAEDRRQPRTVERESWVEEERRLNYELPADLPVYPDFMLAWSTVPGYFSFRLSSGSPFINHLCDGLRKHKEDDLLAILTWVQRQVAIKYSSYAPSTVNDPSRSNIHNKKQMPWIASMLTRNVYFC